jgi:quercetin dioxygenase-like cupin family protein
MKISCIALLAVACSTGSLAQTSGMSDMNNAALNRNVGQIERITTTNTGEKITLPAAAITNPVFISGFVTLAPGQATAPMNHPAPIWIYVLKGVLTVEVEGGKTLTYPAGSSFVQTCFHWHRGVNLGTEEMRFVGVAITGEGVPPMLGPPGSESEHATSSDRKPKAP